MPRITVTSLEDTIANDGAVTLREAIIAANNNTSVDGSVAGSGADEIQFDPTVFAGVQTITLELGELEVTEDLTLTGLGANNLTIDANQMSRVINVTGDVPLTVAGLTLTGGMSANQGGGIFSGGDVTLTNSSVSGNASERGGGGIFSFGNVTLTNSTVSGNSTAGGSGEGDGSGGGIFSGGNVTLTDSTVSDNSGFDYGGGIDVIGNVTLTNSTVSGNELLSGEGGGIFSNGNVALINSTISGNAATIDGGGIYSVNGGTIDNSTITNNTANSNDFGLGDGGGIFNRGGTFTIRNSIIAGNIALGREAADVSGDGINGDNNNILGTAVGNGNGSIGTGSDIVLDTSGLAIADILNTTLANNGGSTFTHALVEGSAAIDASGAGATANDQRGTAVVGTRDIGAFEFVPPGPEPGVSLVFDQLEITLPDFPETGNFGNDSDDLLLGDGNANAFSGLGGNDILAGFGSADRLDGNAGRDVILGNAGNDTIAGGAGDDFILAGKNNDLATGGEGIDVMLGGLGSDTFDGNAGNDVVFGNRGADVLDGDDGDDVLFGGRGQDIVLGGAGNDVLSGNLGNDLLIGGTGGDRFDFRAGDGVDTIADFTDGVDIIGLLNGLTFADVTIAQVGNDTQIAAAGLVVTLQNVDVGAIDSADFAVL